MSAPLNTGGWWNAAAWWRKSLAGQFITLLLLALLAAQALTMLISWDDQTKSFKRLAEAEFIGRTATLARLMESMPGALRTEVLAAGGTGFTRFWTTSSEPLDIAAFKEEAIRQLEAPLPGSVSLGAAGYPPFQSGGEFNMALDGLVEPMRRAQTEREWHKIDPDLNPLPMQAKYVQLAPNYGMGIAAPLSDGTWLNSVYYKTYPSPFWNAQTLSSIGLTAVLLSVLGIFFAWTFARPLRQLTHSAEALGRGETVEALPECGPDDIRRTCAAFNQMQARLTRFVSDRTRMLAAISHDLRTPITTLRLRAEYVEDEGLKQKMLDTLAEMQSMTDATLTFAKEDAALEKTRPVDLSSLVESICEDQVELGHDVAFAESERLIYRCRPDALRRALRNLIENAVRYGGHARISLSSNADGIAIQVADSGPGIPEALREQVFSPFFRIEHSRNRHTGGIGLGLAIARAITRHHGGDITLGSNNPGLIATIVLPPQSAGGVKLDRLRLAARLRSLTRPATSDSVAASSGRAARNAG